MELNNITVLKELVDGFPEYLNFIIAPDVHVTVHGDIKNLNEIYNDFRNMTPIEQRAYLNAVLFERLSK